jgi:hypothetical protein
MMPKMLAMTDAMADAMTDAMTDEMADAMTGAMTDEMADERNRGARPRFLGLLFVAATWCKAQDFLCRLREPRSGRRGRVL